MSIPGNKAVVRRFFEEALNQQQLDVLGEIMAPDFTGQGEHPPGREDEKRMWQGILAAFPDAQVVIEDQIAEEDKVVTRWSVRATHLQEFMGNPPTGKEIRTSGIHIHRLSGGRIVEAWAVSDELGVLQQLGLLPMPGTPTPP
jgi:steroid delta-isomerase-like uncharacterized protein